MDVYSVYSIEFTTLHHGNGVADAIGKNSTEAFNALKAQGKYNSTPEEYQFIVAEVVGASEITVPTLVSEKYAGKVVIVGPKGDKGDPGDVWGNTWGNITGNINNQTDLKNILGDCTAENIAADKTWVNSSISTNTATFRGTFDCTNSTTSGSTILAYLPYTTTQVTPIAICGEMGNHYGHYVGEGEEERWETYGQLYGCQKYDLPSSNWFLEISYKEGSEYIALNSFNSPNINLTGDDGFENITLRVDSGGPNNWSVFLNKQDATKADTNIKSYHAAQENNNGSILNYISWNNGTGRICDNNDYVFVARKPQEGATTYSRYKYSSTNWVYEYTLNNSSFTATQWAAINSGINTTKVGLIDNIPIEKGTGTNSIIQRSLNNQAISSGSIALGSNNIAGIKGWYYKTVDFTNNKIYLSTTQVVPTSGTGTTEAFTSGLVVGNKLSIVNNAKYDNSCTITAVDRNCITVNSLPFSTIASVTTLETDDYTISSIDNPTVGNVDLGEDAVCIGDSNKAAYAAFAMGRSNQAFGNYAYVEGRQNKGGYSTHVEGMLNTANGQYSHAEGYNNTTSGNYSHVEGNQNEAIATDAHAEGWQTKARGNYSHSEGYNSETGGTATSNDKTAGSEASFGVYAHVEGNSNIAKGTSSHAEGKTTFASGEASHAEGDRTKASGAATHSEGRNTVASGTYAHAEGSNTQSKGTASHTEGMYTVANNNYEHAEGKYNVSNTNTIHSIGIGGGANNRRNAFEVLQNGSIYAYNIGEYDGTNPTSGTNDLKTVIDKKIDKVTNAISGNLAKFNSNGSIENSGINSSSVIINPEGGQEGQVLTKVAGGACAWAGINSGYYYYDQAEDKWNISGTVAFTTAIIGTGNFNFIGPGCLFITVTNTATSAYSYSVNNTPYNIVSGDDGKTYIHVAFKEYSSAEIEVADRITIPAIV